MRGKGMLQGFTSRPAHYALLVAAHLLLTLPNLGAHTLWDMDEGVNAEASREMLESGNWVTPYFNYKMRTAKPVMLYWLEAPSMLLFGSNEFGARLPSVFCGLAVVLLTYELARAMYRPSTGLLAGLVLASCIEFCLLSHAATPDAPLLCFFVLGILLYWRGSTHGRTWWYAPVGVAVGLAVLTKGPVGLALPAAIVGLHLLSIKNYRAAFSWRLGWLLLAFVLTAGPWYAMVALDTKGKWITAFFLHENFDRFNVPQENHRGGWWYHMALFVVLFAPWSVFLGVTLWNALREVKRPHATTDDQPVAMRLLLIWFGVVMLVFSAAATKLPNYILPLYPAAAIMTARVVDRWRTGEQNWPRWLVHCVTVSWATVGMITIFAILIAGGRIVLPIKGLYPMPAIASWAWLGGFLIVSALLFAWHQRTHRTKAVASLALGAVFFLGGIAAFPTVAMNEYKAPQPLVEQFRLNDTSVELRMAGLHWNRQSVVFYAQRELIKLDTMPQTNDLLALDIPTYVFIPAKLWPDVKDRIVVPHEVLGEHYDFYARDQIKLIANPAGVRRLHIK